MYPRTRYLEWALQHGGSCTYDLGASGSKSACSLLDTSRVDLHDVGGWENLRTAIANANDVPRTHAVAALGTAHAVWLAYAALVSPGDEILIEAPAYEPLVGAAQGIGASIERYDRPKNKGFQFDPEIAARAIGPKTKAVVVSNLHNPSGARASHEALKIVAEAAARVGAHVIVDEVYAPFDELCDAEGVWRKTSMRIADNVVAVSSLTKCYGLGPHRVGWVLAPADIARRVEAVMLATCAMLPISHANLACAAFSALPTLAKQATRSLAEKRARVSAWVASRSDLSWHAPEAGLFGFVSLEKKAADVRGAIERGMREEDVMVVPGEFFDMPNGFRLAWSLDASLVDEALVRLGRVIDSM
ncbi:MAG: aminotransferase class I/II-fold pyridoxal phosphate-dependent enzyme [Polyangiaceae bacterium]